MVFVLCFLRSKYCFLVHFVGSFVENPRHVLSTADFRVRVRIKVRVRVRTKY